MRGKTNFNIPRVGDERDGVSSKECRRGIGNGCDTRSGVRLLAETLALGVPRGWVRKPRYDLGYAEAAPQRNAVVLVRGVAAYEKRVRDHQGKG